MRTLDIIEKKKKNIPLSFEEISFLVGGYVDGEIPDYQMSAFLMAVYFNGMTDEELLYLTMVMRDSGEIIDLSNILGIKVDKHSTGGVGDKTSMVVAPLVAACGGTVAKMSGRGLGFTGGTLDKLESIPGFRTDIGIEKFYDIVNQIGVSIIGQTADVAPADKKMYALRDVTQTVNSIPLIASSIMSKKLASGCDKIILDVTYGSGAFIKDESSAKILAKKMETIGNGAGKETKAILSKMDVPLGKNVGNINEVIEAVETLKGNGPKDFVNICKIFSSEMLKISGITDVEKKLEEAISSGRALEKFAQMVEMQGGNPRYIYDTSLFDKPKYSMELKYSKDKFNNKSNTISIENISIDKNEWSSNSNRILHMNTEMCGIAATMLGAGRETLDSVIDPTAGIEFLKKTGDEISEGEVLAILHSESESKLQNAANYLTNAYECV